MPYPNSVSRCLSALRTCLPSASARREDCDEEQDDMRADGERPFDGMEMQTFEPATPLRTPSIAGAVASALSIWHPPAVSLRAPAEPPLHPMVRWEPLAQRMPANRVHRLFAALRRRDIKGSRN